MGALLFLWLVKLFGGLSEAYAFVDLAQKAYGPRPVASATGLV